jgi:UPF0716 protein FxsA
VVVLIGFVVFVCWAVAELFVAIKVGEAIGALPTILLLIASWPIGTWAVRTQGGAAWRRLGDAVAAGRPPGREVLDGVLILIGGTLLIIPGFIGDILGACLLLPPTRALTRRMALRNVQSRLVAWAAGFAGPRASYDVDSTATDVEPPPLTR